MLWNSTTEERAVARFAARYKRFIGKGNSLAFSLEFTSGRIERFGSGPPSYSLKATSQAGDEALATADLLVIGEAFMAGSIDIRGDVMAAMHSRAMLSDFHPLVWLGRYAPSLMRGWSEHDAASIGAHYDRDPDFFSTFLDKEYTCYTHGVFLSDDESLDTAIERKLQVALDAIAVPPGGHVLDVGGGWGAFVKFAGSKGIRVTSLTLSAESEAYMSNLIRTQRIPADVAREHFLSYSPGARYDAIVNMGATEHLPNYKASMTKYAELIRPGGKIYVDALAMRSRFRASSFMVKHIYPGDSSPLVLHRYLAAVSQSPFFLESVTDDRWNYYLTCKAWVSRLEAAEDEIRERWGLDLYRRFHAYLVGSAASFADGLIQAYRIVLRAPEMLTERPNDVAINRASVPSA